MTHTNSKSTATVLYLSHGAGPMPLLGDPGHSEMVASLKGMAGDLPKPKAIILISAHWEETAPAITQAENPSLIYDYYGFPEQSYEIQYPAPGHPELAQKAHAALDEGGMKPLLDGQRGFDHGVFVPLKIMYPQADIPCIQISLLKSLDPAEHLSLGRALSQVEHEGLLIIGSGFSFHNMRAFFAPETSEMAAGNEAFELWLNDTCSNPHLNEDERMERLANWTEAPSARYCHPREEHLLPLHVCYGAAGRPCSKYINLEIIGKKSSLYLWD